MKLITNALIANMKPCESRYENYLNYYKGQELEFDAFLDLDKITYNDKVWVAKKLLNKNQLVHWALLCAQSVLPLFCLSILTINDLENVLII